MCTPLKPHFQPDNHETWSECLFSYLGHVRKWVMDWQPRCNRNTVENGVKHNTTNLSQTTNVRLIQTEEFAEDDFKFDENGREFSIWVENTVGKGRNCSFRAIYPFPTVFSREFFCRH